MLQLFPDEQLLTESDNGAVTLTTHRIAYEYRDLGRSYNQSIMLEHITSCENIRTSNIFLLMIGCVGVVGAILAAANTVREGVFIGLIVGIACCSIYLLSRSNYIIVASPSTKMLIKVNGMKRERVLEFINKIEQAKYKRVSKQL